MWKVHSNMGILRKKSLWHNQKVLKYKAKIILYTSFIKVCMDWNKQWNNGTRSLMSLWETQDFTNVKKIIVVTWRNILTTISLLPCMLTTCWLLVLIWQKLTGWRNNRQKILKWRNNCLGIDLKVFWTYLRKNI